MRLILFILIVVSIVSCERLAQRPDEFAVYDTAQYERVSINYEVHGKSDTCLIFIHGWNLNLHYWDEQVKHFSTRYKVLTIDLAGHGNSSRDRTNWTAESFAKDIVSVMDKESVDKAILVGHAMGGDVALEVANLFPNRVSGLIGIDCFRDPDILLTDSYRTEFRSFLGQFKRNYVDMADQMARQNIRTKDRNVISRIVNDYRSADPKVAIAIYKNMIPLEANQKYKIRKISLPLVLVGGDYAPYDTAALNVYAGSKYRLMTMEGAGQFPMIEQPTELNMKLEEALSQIQSMDKTSARNI